MTKYIQYINKISTQENVHKVKGNRENEDTKIYSGSVPFIKPTSTLQGKKHLS